VAMRAEVAKAVVGQKEVIDAARCSRAATCWSKACRASARR
jgi:hypothetical protein